MVTIECAFADYGAAENWVRKFPSQTLPSEVIEALDQALSRGEKLDFTKPEAIKALWAVQSVDV